MSEVGSLQQFNLKAIPGHWCFLWFVHWMVVFGLSHGAMTIPCKNWLLFHAAESVRSSGQFHTNLRFGSGLSQMARAHSVSTCVSRPVFTRPCLQSSRPRPDRESRRRRPRPPSSHHPLSSVRSGTTRRDGAARRVSRVRVGSGCRVRVR